MRLLNTSTIQVEEFDDDQIPRYAILSHTWLEEEITFQEVDKEYAKGKKGYKKIVEFCSLARANGFNYGWVDTCCIDKTSSSELSEAINSMYRWYQEAEVCYAYLPDVTTREQFPKSRWFTRGWTLQELVAPSKILFFIADWIELGTKASLGREISDCTGIPHGILSGDEDLETASIAQRMSWAASRRTTRTEDRAYSLMGIFGINMPLLYGEGKNAFIRLQEEIMRVTDDQSLYAWTHSEECGGLLATTPEAFQNSGNIISWNPLTPYNSSITVTNQGAHLDLPFIGLGADGVGIAILHCTEIGNEEELICIYLRDLFLTMDHFERCKTEQLYFVSLQKFSPAQYLTRRLCIKLRGLQAKTSRGQQGQAYRNQRSESTEQQEASATEKGFNSTAEQMINLDFIDKHTFGYGLSYVAMRGYGKSTAIFMDRPDVNVNMQDGEGYSALLHAAANGHEGVVWLLLTRRDVQIDLTDNCDRNVLSHAARGGHGRLLFQLLTRKDTQTYLVDKRRRSVLSHAAENGHISVVQMISRLGRVDPNIEDVQGRTALWYAAMNNHTVVIQSLLDIRWVNQGARDKEGVTALWHATAHGNEEIVNRLLENVGTEDKAYGDRTALCEASAKGYTLIVEHLLRNNADIEATDEADATPLWHAAVGGHERIIEMLLGKGAVAEVRPKNEQSALWHACANGHNHIVEMLLTNGACVYDENENSLVGLQAATENGHHAVVETFLLNSSMSEVVANNKKATSLVLTETILHGMEVPAAKLLSRIEQNRGISHVISTRDLLLLATMSGHEGVVRMLLQNGANVNQAWKGGKVLTYAIKTVHGCGSIADALLELPRGGWKSHVVTRFLLEPGNYPTGRDGPLWGLEKADYCQVNALWCAVMEGNAACVDVLLEHGASLPSSVKVQQDATEHGQRQYDAIVQMLRRRR